MGLREFPCQYPFALPRLGFGFAVLNDGYVSSLHIFFSLDLLYSMMVTRPACTSFFLWICCTQRWLHVRLAHFFSLDLLYSTMVMCPACTSFFLWICCTQRWLRVQLAHLFFFGFAVLNDTFSDGNSCVK